MTNTGCEGPDLVICWSSRNHPKSSGIHQESLIGHLGIIKSQKYNEIQLKTRKSKEKSSKSQLLFEHMFEIVGTCLCLHMSGFSTFSFFNFSDVQQYEESTSLRYFSWIPCDKLSFFDPPYFEEKLEIVFILFDAW